MDSLVCEQQLLCFLSSNFVHCCDLGVQSSWMSNVRDIITFTQTEQPLVLT